MIKSIDYAYHTRITKCKLNCFEFLVLFFIAPRRFFTIDRQSVIIKYYLNE